MLPSIHQTINEGNDETIQQVRCHLKSLPSLEDVTSEVRVA